MTDENEDDDLGMVFKQYDFNSMTDKEMRIREVENIVAEFPCGVVFRKEGNAFHMAGFTTPPTDEEIRSIVEEVSELFDFDKKTLNSLVPSRYSGKEWVYQLKNFMRIYDA